MNLVKKFRKSDDYEKMLALVSGMRNMVIEVSTEENATLSKEDWQGFIASLFDSVEPEKSWTVSELPQKLDPDDRVEFCTFATAVALSAIAREHLMHPEDLKEEERSLFEEAAATFELKGFGEDNLFQVCEILLIFLEGGLPLVLTQYYRNNPLRKSLLNWQQNLQKRMDEKNTLLPFGGDYSEIFALILSGLDDELGEKE